MSGRRAPIAPRRRGRVAAAAGLALGIVLSTASGVVARPQGLDIVDLYRELQVAQPTGFPRYELRVGPKGVHASGGILYGPRARVGVTLDRGHYFLKFEDRGASDEVEPFVTEFAMWLDKDGAPLVGLSEYALKGGMPFGGRIRFYSRLSGRWNMVTREVWPSLDQPLCGTEPEELDETTAAFENLGRAIAYLPRLGTAVEVWCVPPSPKAGSGERLDFAREEGRFRRGATLAPPPPWEGGTGQGARPAP